MGSRSIIERRRRSRVGAALISAFTTLALVLGLAPAAQAASDISVYVTFEGYNIGQGYYVEPVKVTVPEGSTAAAVTESVLDETSHQFTALDAGETSSAGWYLSGVKGFDKGTANVPSYITSQPGSADRHRRRRVPRHARLQLDVGLDVHGQQRDGPGRCGCTDSARW
ncbi:hypothetical protein [Aeromicrobium sp. UC242_57]|uniref:hypothetical protein n=1 Tax=Aeromicrobium sp. UC242_57 TaxID=3374624 RepID=UPI003789C25C